MQITIFKGEGLFQLIMILCNVAVEEITHRRGGGGGGHFTDVLSHGSVLKVFSSNRSSNHNGQKIK